MFKVLTTLSLIVLLTMGCASLRPTQAAPVTETGSSTAETASIPTVHLESSGSSVQGLESSMSVWVEANGSGSGGGAAPTNPPAFPGILAVQAGQSIEIIVTPTSPLASLIVTEIDMLGVPTTSSVLKSTTSATPYSPSAVGLFVLQVTVQQSWQKYVTYLFEVNVTP
jgi:hypothetical protein